MPNWFVIILTSGAAGLGVWLLSRRFIRANLRRFLATARRPGGWRALLPVLPICRLITPVEKNKKLAAAAGLEESFGRESVLRYKSVSVWASLLIAFLASLNRPAPEAILIGLLLLGLAVSWPELYLARRAAAARRLAERDLGAFVDLLRLNLAAGLNTQAAIRAAAKAENPGWQKILKKTTLELDAGIPLPAALERLTKRARLPDFDRLVSALKQASALGASLSATLKAQARLLRFRRRQAAEESARTAAVKIALPLVLCIFPALLIVYLAPAVLRMFNSV